MNDLNKPLGAPPAEASSAEVSSGFLPFPRTSRAALRDIPYGMIAIGGCFALLGSLVVFARIVDDKHGGEPYAQAQIEAPQAKGGAASLAGGTAGAGVNAASGETKNAAVSFGAAAGSGSGGTSVAGKDGVLASSAAQVEQSSGVKVVRGENGKVPGALIIEIPDRVGVQLTPAPDKRLVEMTKQGPLPRIAADGAKPLEIYARPVVTGPKLKSDAPRIAVVFGGLGLAEGPTQDAISQLPGEISLAFAPYGKALERQVRQARENGHEVLLQVPMQGFDYPANNPGAETLLSDADEMVNMRNLHQLMSRFSGYVGIMTYQGGRFTAEANALTPVLRDVGSRGLMILDDGSSPRSLVSALAGEANVAALRGEVMVDTPPKSDAISAALTKLEARARQNGSAIGVANGYPASIEQLASWARGLEGRGIALVPVSALVGQAAKPVAERVP